jgi:hypothetical protein
MSEALTRDVLVPVVRANTSLRKLVCDMHNAYVY